MKRCVAALAVLSVMTQAESAWADTARVRATLIDVSGSVWVDGVAYRGAPLEVGDVIRVVGDGKATVAYADGCSVAVTVKSSAIVRSASPCATGGPGVNGTVPGTGAAAPGVGGATPAIGGAATGVGGTVVGSSGAIIGIGAGIAAAAVVAKVALNKPASP